MTLTGSRVTTDAAEVTRGETDTCVVGEVSDAIRITVCCVIEASLSTTTVTGRRAAAALRDADA